MLQVTNRNLKRLGRGFYLTLLVVSIVLGIVSSSSAEKGMKAPPMALQENPYVVGQWEDSYSTGPMVHASLLPNKKVMHWPQHGFFPPQHPTYTRLWECIIDPTSGLCNPDYNYQNGTDIWYYNEDLFCSGHSLLPDGRVWITGGTYKNLGNDGIEATTYYNYQAVPANTGFSDGPEMIWGRWYPSNVTLGEQNRWALVAAGTYCPERKTGSNECAVDYVNNNVPEILKSDGTLQRLYGASDVTLPLYPWLFYASNGKVFYAGPEAQALWLNLAGNGDWETPDPDLQSSMYRESGSAVMYDKDKVLISGGGPVLPTSSAEIIDLSDPSTAAWTATNPMNNSRKHHNLTLLADGKVLATGGTMGKGFNNSCMYYAMNEAEIWDPDTGAWTIMSRMTRRRVYHSTALLLPDARVLVGGTTEWERTGVCPPIQNEYRTEIFTPPYLFNSDGTMAVRPIIDTAPEVITLGQDFTISMGAAATISDVTLVKLTSVTHSINMDQRISHLDFLSSGKRLSVTAPPNGLECPPGYYMLYLINSAGVPSVSKIVRVAY